MSLAEMSPIAAPHVDRVLDFLEGHASHDDLPDVAWGPIGSEVHTRTYARPVLEVGHNDQITERLETWPETVRRVVQGNLAFAPEWSRLPDEEENLFRLLQEFKAVPAGRHLWTTGTGSSASRNCWVSGWSEARLSDHVKFLAGRLFEGGGVGSNYSNDLLGVTKPILGSVSVEIICHPDHADYAQVVTAAADSLTAISASTLADDVYLVQDTREGWVQAWVDMIDLATTAGNHRVIFDVSGIRQYGALLVATGGQASGPAPLVESLVMIAAALAPAVGRQLNSLEAMSIDHEIAKSVTAGGKRRSARMSLKLWSDPDIFDFMACKADQMSHWSTNISVESDAAFAAALADAADPAHEQATKVLAATAAGMAANGEPGIVDTDLHSTGETKRIRICNPCAEAGLQYDPEDASGEACNLGSVNLEPFANDLPGAIQAMGLMARFLYRTTLNPFTDEASGRIESVNRRIGAGIMGLQGWCVGQGYRLSDLPNSPYLLEQLHQLRIEARRAADELADEMGLPHPVKVTAVAPTGSISALFGGQAGIHAVTAKMLLRRVRYSANDSSLAKLAKAGYSIVDDPYSWNTKVVSFPMIDPIVTNHPTNVHLIEQADDLSFEQFMAVVLAVQDSFCAGGDGMAVSATALIEPGMDPAVLAADMAPFIGKLKGITVFPNESRVLQPIQPLTQAEFDAAMRDVDESAAFMATLGETEDQACLTGACPVR